MSLYSVCPLHCLKLQSLSLYIDTHGKKRIKPEMDEVIKQMHELKVTELAQKETEKSRKLEPEVLEINQKLKMISQEIRQVNEELLKVQYKMRLYQLKEGEAEETREEEILTMSKQVLENVYQELQEIFLQLSNVQTLERVLKLAEESLQLLQKGEPLSRPREELQKELRKVDLELHKILGKRGEWHIQEDLVWLIRMEIDHLSANIRIYSEKQFYLHEIIQKLLFLIDKFHYRYGLFHESDMFDKARFLIHHVEHLIEYEHLKVTKVDPCSIIMMYLYHVYDIVSNISKRSIRKKL